MRTQSVTCTHILKHSTTQRNTVKPHTRTVKQTRTHARTGQCLTSMCSAAPERERERASERERERERASERERESPPWALPRPRVRPPGGPTASRASQPVSTISIIIRVAISHVLVCCDQCAPSMRRTKNNCVRIACVLRAHCVRAAS